MEVENSWLPTLLCALNDGIKYNDRLRHGETVKDLEDIEEWILQMKKFKHYLREKLSAEPRLFEQYGECLRD